MQDTIKKEEHWNGKRKCAREDKAIEILINQEHNCGDD